MTGNAYLYYVNMHVYVCIIICVCIIHGGTNSKSPIPNFQSIVLLTLASEFSSTLSLQQA